MTARWLAAVLCVACLAAPAGAAGAARWHRIASGGLNISDQVGLARTSDGVLHVAWRRRGGTGEDLLATSITPSGTLGSTVTVVRGWASVGSPALVANGRDLALFFPGAETQITGDPHEGLDLATSADGGASWSVSPTAIATSDFAASRTPAAIISQRGTYLQAWYGGEQTVVHSGLNPLVPAVAGYGQGTDQALAVNNFDQVMVGWCTELQAVGGVFLALVDSGTGARVGAITHLPDSGRCPADTRVALVGSPDEPNRYLLGTRQPGYSDFFVASSSASGRTVRVYEITHTGKISWTSTVAGGSSSKQQVGLASTPRLAGLWAGWRDSDSGGVMVRHLPSGIDWGAKVSVALPHDQSLSQLAFDAQRARVDVIATTSDNANVVSLYTTQVLPGLTLEAARGGFTVLEGANPVSHATVTLGKRTFLTNGSGKSRIRPPLGPGAYTARASKDGYVGATAHFRIP
jgi:hypothetical protein